MNIAIIFAGGVGKRMTNASLPKQFLKLHEKEIIIYTLERFEYCNEIDAIVVSCVKEWIPYLQKLIKRYELNKIRSVVPGGKSGQESIYIGLKEAKRFSSGEKDIVLIHDGVRPFINDETIKKNIECVKENGSAITVTPAIETIIRLENQKVKETINRAQCAMARAPQSFYLKDILRMHERAISEHREEFIDSATMMSYYGMQLFVVEGPFENIKVTTPTDYLVCRAYHDAEENAQMFGN